MPSPRSNPRIFISVAEQSADEHAAGLIRAFRKRKPEASFAGLTGPATRAAGCQTFHDMTAQSAMALSAIRRVPEALGLLHRLKTYLVEMSFDAAVMVDSPTLNLPLARICHRRGIPVLYYIAPQTWAWAAWRNTRIRQRVRRLACIWPFEEEYFRSRGIPATFVGHPALERLLALDVDETRVAQLRAGPLPMITLLPGSRAHVVREVLPGQLEVAGAVKKHFRHARFLIVPANEVVRPLIDSILEKSAAAPAVDVLPPPPERDSVNEGPTGLAAQRAVAIRGADLVLAASGTATLEVAYHGTPMIVMYNASRWMYRLLGRWLISTKYLSIPNILAGRRLIPEFMPYYRSTDPIIATAVELLSTPATLARIRRELHEVIQPLARPGASENAAAELAAMLAESR